MAVRAVTLFRFWTDRGKVRGRKKIKTSALGRSRMHFLGLPPIAEKCSVEKIKISAHGRSRSHTFSVWDRSRKSVGYVKVRRTAARAKIHDIIFTWKEDFNNEISGETDIIVLLIRSVSP